MYVYINNICTYVQYMCFYSRTYSAAAILHRKEKKKEDYALRRQFNEKPRVIPGWPEIQRDLFQL